MVSLRPSYVKKKRAAPGADPMAMLPMPSYTPGMGNESRSEIEQERYSGQAAAGSFFRLHSPPTFETSSLNEPRRSLQPSLECIQRVEAHIDDRAGYCSANEAGEPAI